MTPDQWAAALPHQRDEHVRRYGPPPAHYAHVPAPSQANPAAIIGIVCALLGLVVFPVLLGPLALIMGAIGYAVCRPGRHLAAVAVVLGLVDLIVALALYAALS